MVDKVLTPEFLSGLGAKLDTFAESLTKEEQAVLLGVFGIASSTIVASHSGEEVDGDKPSLVYPVDAKLPPPSVALLEGFKSIGGVPDPDQPELQDSIGVGAICVSWSKDYNKSIERPVLPDVAPDVTPTPDMNSAIMRIRGLKRMSKP
jgi:hypothetical protein